MGYNSQEMEKFSIGGTDFRVGKIHRVDLRCDTGRILSQSYSVFSKQEYERDGQKVIHSKNFNFFQRERKIIHVFVTKIEELDDYYKSIRIYCLYNGEEIFCEFHSIQTYASEFLFNRYNLVKIVE